MISLPPGDVVLATELAKALHVGTPAIAKRTREGKGPAGRFLLGGRAAYPRDAVLEWLRQEEASAPARLEAARARAAHARASRAARRTGGAQ